MDALHVAPDLRGLVWGLVLSGTGLLFEWLRRITTQSVSENKMDAAIADAKAALPPGTLQP
jgi:hypothetical protein